jgi:branched-chain amino acid aminotransferase
VFLVVNERLVTPPLAAGCLEGVTRGLLIDRCGIDVDERDVPIDALASADEAFLTSATRDVHPIRAVDGRPLPDCPGAFTKTAINAYAALLAGNADPR